MFQLKTYRLEMRVEKHSFFILSRGLNTGKPMNEPCPNCFVCICNSREDKENLYWLLFALWQSKEIKRQLIGSVILYIRKRDLEKIIQKKAQGHILSTVKKSIPVLREFHRKEQAFLKMSEQVRELKTAFLGSLVR
ncbi:MAG: hypothetical protein M9897_08845 [Brumimicrobium sp.]|nr:hypothetical protein [Brumimicrobium sp.]